ncbi:acyltransferase family protein [Staphylococcus pettenkoferi]|uniref:Acyltransferase family protein n=1 Tax=Staphylococcus pettenkoferi TaxID=170573 RepID=A0A9Q4D586_9STAP|nr:acyltransferase family protein [Staphylococcus pettenkoferi]MCY1568545.1 acyltransferase family protein [Staphylococcus pettenkoferi]MCY1575587.1 acyltransferase family protein [Staphylococcus pettenkoferi]MCY1593707.1 acyltransferase family protein [Staphylococcus pettenkoferi]MCY1618005.1 acyltransferase family protein [Staphylococcus pettenkoferi]
MGKSLQRDYYFDNARAILIFFVVFGHLLQPYKSESPILSALYLTIYSFHMPGFLFISGYFAKKIGEQGYLEKVSRKLLIPYFIFFAFFSFYYYFTGQTDKVTFDPFNPVFALWFLLTLFLFHVILVIVKDYKPYIVLPVAIIISLFAGFSSNINEYLSFSRTIIFFPIFYIGYLFQKRHTAFLRDKRLIPISIAILISFFVIYYIHPINADWLLGSTPYTSLEDGDQGLYSPLKRLVLYVIILVAMFSVFNLVPQGQHWFTYMGGRTLQVYLLHGLVIGVVRGFELYPFKEPISMMTYIYLIGLSALIVYILTTNFVVKWSNPIIHLRRPSQFNSK